MKSMESIESTSAALNERMYRFDQLPGASASVIAEAAYSDIHIDRNSVNYLLFGGVGMAGAIAVVVGAVTTAQVLPGWLARVGIAVSRDAILVPVLAGVIAAAWILTSKHAKWQARRRLAALSVPQHRARDAVAALRAVLPAHLSLLDQNLQSASERMLKVYATGNMELAYMLSALLNDAFGAAAFVSLGASSPAIGQGLAELRAALAALGRPDYRAA
ncbi:hypothetical protein F2P45_00780 [Massilia sp. CCM 8733]|uniref:Uncharacterized protein n=1 Tax=Massilia mucilaginosa TaxID=2609282 RepID=A0ABX0NL90_9BURK|nr:hypothetical protein [Massilia mucilaginosa]NHZ87573.1 hypothetical protein [Massilia mucilaginosa]